MSIKGLIQALSQLDENDELLCQVVGTKEGAWNVGFTLSKIPNTNKVIMTVGHSEIHYLPTDCSHPTKTLMCEKGHLFIALPDHPVLLTGVPLCPHCAAKGGVSIRM